MDDRRALSADDQWNLVDDVTCAGLLFSLAFLANTRIVYQRGPRARAFSCSGGAPVGRDLYALALCVVQLPSSASGERNALDCLPLLQFVNGSPSNTCVFHIHRQAGSLGTRNKKICVRAQGYHAP